MSTTSVKIAIAGASGETGLSILNELLKRKDEFTVTALVRPSSVEKPQVQDIKEKGANVIGIDLDTPLNELVKSLQGQQIVISCVIPFASDLEIKLADAAKAAGVERFIPSFFGPVCPPKGVLVLRETKEDVLNHIKKIHLPYTVIDVGWWYQGTLPRLSSGKIDYMIRFPITHIYGDGNHPSALTDLRDIGPYVSRIVKDTRTLNRYVFVYNEIWTQEQVFSLLEQASGEKIEREYLAREAVEAAIGSAGEEYAKEKSTENFLGLAINQYANTVWLRGDNLPKTADYLGYLDGKDLYPDVSYRNFETFVKEGLEGKGKKTYEGRKLAFEK
ncbi:unnamed protein product [Clonostachys rosea]|uniref:NmrA-like domain-containing protein n=1 Tax=Bionectria ochroleuca TaxID=29856 RepID=A0ABY6U915_BIOOC|nr:unnamed protein product [Clonostachys rosea]